MRPIRTLRAALAVLCVALSGVALALTPTQDVLLFGKIKPVWTANFLTTPFTWGWSGSAWVSSPAGLTYAGQSQKYMFDSTGTLTTGPNNLLTQSNTFNVWSATGTTVYTPGVADPFGGMNATTISATTGTVVYRGYTSTIGVNYVQSIWLRRRSGTGAIYIKDANNNNVAVTISSTWTQYYTTATATSTTSYAGLYIAIAGDAVDAYAATGSAVTYETSPRPGDQVITQGTAFYGPRQGYSYNGSAWVPAGMLVEQASNGNYAQYSQNFGSGWTSPGAATTITFATGVTSPDGTSQMALLTQTNTSGLIYGNSTGITTTGANYTSSGFFKAGATSPAPYFEVAFTDVSGSYAIAYFNSSTGAYVASSAARGSIVSYGSTSVGNGIWRCWVTASFTTITTGLRPLLNVSNDTSGNTIAGQTGYVWGSQVDPGSFPLSYLPNPTASSPGPSRAADVVSLNGVPLAALQGAQGSVGAEVLPYAYSTGASRFVMSDLLVVNVPISKASSNSTVRIYRSGTIAEATIGGSGSWSGGLPLRSVSAWNAAAGSIGANGGTVASGTPGLSSITNMYLGSDSSANFMNGWFRSLGLYNQRLPDPTLKAKSVVNAPY